ncbi:hypothetical protein GGS24DRAFT_513803, partial [Hypoxylon argillaceum]
MLQRPLRYPSPSGRFRNEFVAFFHPRYPDNTPPLLTLAAVDVTTEGKPGIHFDTAQAACGIVACNPSGYTYFAHKRPSLSEPQGHDWIDIERPYDDVLPIGHNYYFIVDCPRNRYPVVANFNHWRFPHNDLPFLWEELALRTFNSNVERDSGDDVFGTGHPKYARSVSRHESTGLDRVAPFFNKLWLKSNMMGNYYRPHIADNIIMSLENNRKDLERLNHEIYNLFGDCKLRSTRQNPVSRRFELHPSVILKNALMEKQDISQDWSNPYGERAVGGIRCEHLFARFAYNVLSARNYKFLNGVGKYTVCFYNFEKEEQNIAELGSDEIRQYSRLLLPRPQHGNSIGHETVSPRRVVEEYYETDESSNSATLSESPDTTENRPRGRTGPLHYTNFPSFYYNQQAGGSSQEDIPPMPAAPRPRHATLPSIPSPPPIPPVPSVEAAHAGLTLLKLTPPYDDDEPQPATSLDNPKRLHDDEEDRTDAHQLFKRSRLGCHRLYRLDPI